MKTLPRVGCQKGTVVTRKQLLVIVLIIMFLLALLPVGTVSAETGWKTQIVFVADDYWFDAELDGLVNYSVGEDGATIRMQAGALQKGVFPRVRWIDIACHDSPADWPASHTPDWAASEFIVAELDRHLRSIADEQAPRPEITSGEHLSLIHI